MDFVDTWVTFRYHGGKWSIYNPGCHPQELSVQSLREQKWYQVQIPVPPELCVEPLPNSDQMTVKQA